MEKVQINNITLREKIVDRSEGFLQLNYSPPYYSVLLLNKTSHWGDEIIRTKKRDTAVYWFNHFYNAVKDLI